MGSPLKKSKPHTSIHMWGLRVDPAAPEKQIGEKYLLFRGACTPFRQAPGIYAVFPLGASPTPQNRLVNGSGFSLAKMEGAPGLALCLCVLFSVLVGCLVGGLAVRAFQGW